MACASPSGPQLLASTTTALSPLRISLHFDDSILFVNNNIQRFFLLHQLCTVNQSNLTGIPTSFSISISISHLFNFILFYFFISDLCFFNSRFLHFVFSFSIYNPFLLYSTLTFFRSALSKAQFDRMIRFFPSYEILFFICNTILVFLLFVVQIQN